MDWFETLTGFRETDYVDTRAKLKVEGTRLRSLVNNKNYGIGDLELVPLQSLRERVDIRWRPARAAQGKCGDRQRPTNASVPRERWGLFQVASQFNLAGDDSARR